MTSGGARVRSGPAPDPKSGRSASRGLDFTALPSEGYSGVVPEFPLSPAVVIYEYFDDGKKIRDTDEGATESRRDREAELWAWVWSLPQAAAWAVDRSTWLDVAMYVRTFAVCESSEAKAADKSALHRFRDDLGLSPAGLARNGWTVAKDELGKRREAATAPKRESARDRRLRAVANGDG
jgi:hypothetical protein